MILFLVLATLLSVLVAMALVAAARPTDPASDGGDRRADRERMNVAIYRERLAELQAEREAGRIDAVQEAALLAELQCLLVDDVAPAGVPGATRGPQWWVRSLLLVVPALSLGIYVLHGLGQPVREWLDLSARGADPAALLVAHGEGVAVSGDLSLPDAARLTQSLLARQPRDAEAWFRLGQAWIDLDAPELALGSLRTAARLAPRNIEILLTMADLELTLADGRLTDRVREVFDAALAVDPMHQGLLMAYGMAAFSSGDYATTVMQWRRLLAALDPASEGAALLQRSIDVAEQRATSGAQSAVPVRVVSASYAGELPMEAALFVIVRPVGSAGPPVAVRRLPPVLPVEITLTDADQMLRGEPFATRGPLEVLARLSMSGTPAATRGDLESEPVPLVFPLKAPAVLALDRRLP